MTTGMILGKFYPPHQGHQYLIEFSKQSVDKLIVIVESIIDENISVTKRIDWLSQIFPEVTFIALHDHNPQDPSQAKDFWNIWKNSLLKILPFIPDIIFASEYYGIQLAKILDSNFVPVDPKRSYCNISATKIKENFSENFDYLISPAQHFFRQRICICGPESSGKSTLTKWLAKTFDAAYVTEYARTFLENINREIKQEDLYTIAKGQAINENIASKSAQQLLFVDTGAKVSALWSEFLFNRCSDQLATFCEQQEYDLYLLCQPDIPWISDSVRYLPKSSNQFFDRLYEILPKEKVVIINGDFTQRKQIAQDACNKHIKRSTPF